MHGQLAILSTLHLWKKAPGTLHEYVQITAVLRPCCSMYCLCYCVVLCKCILYYCHQLSTQLQLTNISTKRVIRIQSHWNHFIQTSSLEQLYPSVSQTEDGVHKFIPNVSNWTIWHHIRDNHILLIPKQKPQTSHASEQLYDCKVWGGKEQSPGRQECVWQVPY